MLADFLSDSSINESIKVSNIVVGVSFSTFSVISFCFMCFEALLFGAYTFKMSCFLIN